MPQIKVTADRLALGDVIQPNKDRVVSVGFIDMKEAQVRIAFQDPYTPPDLFKETVFDADAVLTVERKEA